jgi:hypothetical protein
MRYLNRCPAQAKRLCGASSYEIGRLCIFATTLPVSRAYADSRIPNDSIPNNPY